ncbi:MAG TPA: DUF3806 domain-containing protein [Kofleriaceae bacterium]|nr:DUF3806 domain-containing protein [Kofleriaceae bacterium]
MAQTFHDLTEADLAQLAAQRAVVERYLGNDVQNLENYATPAGKLGLLRAILDAGLFRPNHTYELQCMGVVFGDVFVQVCGWEWRMVEDDLGRDPCIKLPSSTIVIYPLTMISKRVEHGEAVDVFALFDEIAADAERLAAAAPLS